jgi:hypothetical protein
MKSFEEKSGSIFGRFVDSLAKVDLRTALAVPAAIGIAMTLTGAGMEAHGQLHLLQTAGPAALDAYHQTMDDLRASSIGEFLQQGLAGERPTFGGNTEARGMALMAGAPALAAATVLLSRGFVKLREFVETSAEKLRSHPAPERIEPRDFAADDFSEPSYSPRA